MHSTIVGDSGREYQIGKVLHSHPTDKDLDVYAAHCEDKTFVLRRVCSLTFDQCLEHKQEFSDTHRIRTPVDHNEQEKVVVYEYFKEDLLSLVQNNPYFRVAARKQILFEVGKALQELHAKNWTVIDLKPSNIMIDWSLDQQSQILIERVALIDLNILWKFKEGQSLRLPGVLPTRNAVEWTWSSPEGQTGQGIGKPSDLFSFGLICIYTLASRKVLEVDVEELRASGSEPEVETLGRHIVFFGPLCEGLLKHTADNKWNAALVTIAEKVAKAGARFHLSNWQEEEFPNITLAAKCMLLRIMNLDPAKRATIDEILEDPYWG